MLQYKKQHKFSMKRIYKAEIAEKIILSGESINDLSNDCYQIGGKILFDDLSVIRSLGNITFLEKEIPKGLISTEYFDIKINKLTEDTNKIIDSMIKPKGENILRALRIEPTYQDQAESDYKSIVFFHNGECAIEDFQTGEYLRYDKNSTASFYSAYNLDGNLIIRKLQKDIELKNDLTVEQKKNKFKI